MNFFKDHLNLSNNIYDNAKILKDAQIKKQQEVVDRNPTTKYYQTLALNLQEQINNLKKQILLEVGVVPPPPPGTAPVLPGYIPGGISPNPPAPAPAPAPTPAPTPPAPNATPQPPFPRINQYPDGGENSPGYIEAYRLWTQWFYSQSPEFQAWWLRDRARGGGGNSMPTSPRIKRPRPGPTPRKGGGYYPGGN